MRWDVAKATGCEKVECWMWSCRRFTYFYMNLNLCSWTQMLEQSMQNWVSCKYEAVESGCSSKRFLLPCRVSLHPLSSILPFIYNFPFPVWLGTCWLNLLFFKLFFCVDFFCCRLHLLWLINKIRDWDKNWKGQAASVIKETVKSVYLSCVPAMEQ